MREEAAVRPSNGIRVVAGFLASLALFLFMPLPLNRVFATDVRVPGAPVLEQIVATSSSGGVEVAVTLARPGTPAFAPATVVEARIGTRTCAIKGPAWKPWGSNGVLMTTCTLGGFTSGTSVKVAVRAKNVFGWGQWSKAVPFKIIKGRTWNRSG